MNTLYISDLDGTLLQPNVELSNNTIAILNQLISQGMQFSIATARSIASVRQIMKDVNLTIPVILMNGVCIYDLVKEDYVKIETLPQDSIVVLMKVIRQHHLKGFAYVIKDGKLSTYYEDLNSQALKDFYQERVDRYQKQFLQIDDFTKLSNEPLIYFSLLDTKQNLESIYTIIEEMEALNCVLYKDNYSPDLWYLEIYSKTASKYHAVQYLREHYHYDRVVCFGDNRNDLPLFKASDYKIAVGNAVTELQEKADQIIGYHYEDGVALWLKANVQ